MAPVQADARLGGWFVPAHTRGPATAALTAEQSAAPQRSGTAGRSRVLLRCPSGRGGAVVATPQALARAAGCACDATDGEAGLRRGRGAETAPPLPRTDVRNQPAAARLRGLSALSVLSPPLAAALRRGDFFFLPASPPAPGRSTSSTIETAAASPTRTPSFTTRV